MSRFGNINANLLQVSVLLHVSAYTVTVKALSVLVNSIPTITVVNVLNVWHTICTFHTGISTYLSSDIVQSVFLIIKLTFTQVGQAAR